MIDHKIAEKIITFINDEMDKIYKKEPQTRETDEAVARTLAICFAMFCKTAGINYDLFFKEISDVDPDKLFNAKSNAIFSNPSTSEDTKNTKSGSGTGGMMN